MEAPWLVQPSRSKGLLVFDDLMDCSTPVAKQPPMGKAIRYMAAGITGAATMDKLDPPGGGGDAAAGGGEGAAVVEEKENVDPVTGLHARWRSQEPGAPGTPGNLRPLASVSTPLSADTRGGGGRLGASPLTRTPVPSTPAAVEPQQRSEQRRSDGKRQPFLDITKQFVRPGLSNVMPASDAISKLKGKKGLSSRGGGAGAGAAINSRLKPSAPSASSANLRQMR